MTSPSSSVPAQHHSPGPWVVDYGGTLGHIKSVPADAKSGITPTPTVCRYDSEFRADSISDEQAAANARLIAAAPDLLEALQRALNWLSSYPGEGALSCYDQARAAIDKALPPQQQPSSMEKP